MVVGTIQRRTFTEFGRKVEIIFLGRYVLRIVLFSLLNINDNKKRVKFYGKLIKCLGTNFSKEICQ